MDHLENQTERQSFRYTYSAKERDEVQKIRQKYIPREADKMEQLRILDRSVTKKGGAVSMVFGIVGALLLGVGMCCTMVWQDKWFIPGIVVGVAGIMIVSLAYPVYVSIVRKERERIAPEILRLTDELMK